MSDLQQALSEIQHKLNAPKGQYNKFGKYSYRNCEDILEALKPLLGGCVVTVTDDIVEVAGRIYVKATASISLGAETISTTGFAREEENKKGMDSAQLTGSTSSYARKYSLNGLFLIDDNKDPDSNEHGNQVNNSSKQVGNPDIDLIVDAIKRNDIQFARENWQGIIGKYWGDLNDAQTSKLNEMIKG